MMHRAKKKLTSCPIHRSEVIANFFWKKSTVKGKYMSQRRKIFPKMTKKNNYRSKIITVVLITVVLAKSYGNYGNKS